jgi:hypothetical protein
MYTAALGLASSLDYQTASPTCYLCTTMAVNLMLGGVAQPCKSHRNTNNDDYQKPPNCTPHQLLRQMLAPDAHKRAHHAKFWQLTFPTQASTVA